MNTFQNMISSRINVAGFRVKRVLICSGKHYYTLRNKRDSLQDNSTAIIRVEVNVFLSTFFSYDHRFIFSRALYFFMCSVFCYVLRHFSRALYFVTCSFFRQMFPFFVLAVIVFISSFLSS